MPVFRFGLADEIKFTPDELFCRSFSWVNLAKGMFLIVFRCSLWNRAPWGRGCLRSCLPGTKSWWRRTCSNSKYVSSFWSANQIFFFLCVCVCESHRKNGLMSKSVLWTNFDCFQGRCRWCCSSYEAVLPVRALITTAPGLSFGMIVPGYLRSCCMTNDFRVFGLSFGLNKSPLRNHPPAKSSSCWIIGDRRRSTDQGTNEQGVSRVIIKKETTDRDVSNHISRILPIRESVKLPTNVGTVVWGLSISILIGLHKIISSTMVSWQTSSSPAGTCHFWLQTGISSHLILENFSSFDSQFQCLVLSLSFFFHSVNYFFFLKVSRSWDT
jgi:hypothetical protein